MERSAGCAQGAEVRKRTSGDKSHRTLCEDAQIFEVKGIDYEKNTGLDSRRDAAGI